MWTLLKSNKGSQVRLALRLQQSKLQSWDGNALRMTSVHFILLHCLSKSNCRSRAYRSPYKLVGPSPSDMRPLLTSAVPVEAIRNTLFFPDRRLAIADFGTILNIERMLFVPRKWMLTSLINLVECISYDCSGEVLWRQTLWSDDIVATRVSYPKRVDCGKALCRSIEMESLREATVVQSSCSCPIWWSSETLALNLQGNPLLWPKGCRAITRAMRFFAPHTLQCTS